MIARPGSPPPVAEARDLRAIRTALLIAAVTPVLYGGGLVIDPDLASVYVDRLSGGVLQVSAELAYVNRVLGVYIFGFGLLLLLCARDPRRMSPVIAGCAALLFVRGAQRLLSIPELGETFDIPLWRNMVGGGFTVLIGLALWVLRPRGPVKGATPHPAAPEGSRPSGRREQLDAAVPEQPSAV